MKKAATTDRREKEKMSNAAERPTSGDETGDVSGNRVNPHLWQKVYDWHYW
jgi:hypothetical protein